MLLYWKQSFLQHWVYISANSTYHLQQLFQAQLNTRKLRAGKTLQDFEIDVRRTTHVTYQLAQAEILEQIVTQSFIDDVVRNALLLPKYYNKREALGKALELEIAYKASAANWGQCKLRRLKMKRTWSKHLHRTIWL